MINKSDMVARIFLALISILIFGFFIFVLQKWLVLNFIYGFGEKQNAMFARSINEEILGKSELTNNETPYCYMNEHTPWWTSNSPAGCVLVRPESLKKCSFYTRGTTCAAIQIPIEYSGDKEFMNTLFQRIKTSLKADYWYANVFVQDVRRHKVSFHPHFIYKKGREPLKVDRYTHFSKINRKLTLRVWKDSEEYSFVNGQEKECRSLDPDYCLFDRDIFWNK